MPIPRRMLILILILFGWGGCTDDDGVLADQQQYRYMTVDDIKGLDDEHMRTLDTSAALNATIGSAGSTDKIEKGEHKPTVN